MTDTSTLPRTRPVDVPCVFDSGAGARLRLGLIALAGDATVEPDFRALGLPSDIALYVSRVPSFAVTVENLRATGNSLTSAAALILPGQRLDVVAYACTSGTVVVGEAEVVRLVREARPGIPVTTPITGALAAFSKFKVRRVAVLTPYIDDVNQPVVRLLAERGVEVVDLASFNLLSEDDMARVPTEAIVAAAEGLNHADADAVFVSCTALRALGVIGRLEHALGKPVVSSNHALYWHALRLAGYREAIPGFGRLMTL